MNAFCGVEGIILKYNVESAFFHRYVCNILAVKNDFAAIRVVNPKIRFSSTVLPHRKESKKETISPLEMESMFFNTVIPS